MTLFYFDFFYILFSRQCLFYSPLFLICQSMKRGRRLIFNTNYPRVTFIGEIQFYWLENYYRVQIMVEDKLLKKTSYKNGVTQLLLFFYYQNVWSYHFRIRIKTNLVFKLSGSVFRVFYTVTLINQFIHILAQSVTLTMTFMYVISIKKKITIMWQTNHILAECLIVISINATGIQYN